MAQFEECSVELAHVRGWAHCAGVSMPMARNRTTDVVQVSAPSYGSAQASEETSSWKASEETSSWKASMRAAARPALAATCES